MFFLAKPARRLGLRRSRLRSGLVLRGWPKLLCTSANAVRVGGTLGGGGGDGSSKSERAFALHEEKPGKGRHFWHCTYRSIGGDAWVEKAGPALTAVSWNSGPQRKVGLLLLLSILATLTVHPTRNS